MPVEGYCVVSGGRRVEIPYPELDQVGDDGIALSAGPEKAQWEKENGHSISEKGKATNGSAPPWYVPSASGRKEGRSFHHGRVISSLRQRCLYDAHNLTVVEGTVRQLVRCEHTNRVIGISAAFKLAPKPDQEEQETIVRNIYAPITIIADGCFSKFRSQPGLKLPTPETRSHFVGVVLKDVDLPIPRHGTVCLTPEGPVLLYQIGDKGRETRMLVDVKGKLPSVADGSLKVGLADSQTLVLRKPMLTLAELHPRPLRPPPSPRSPTCRPLRTRIPTLTDHAKLLPPTHATGQIIRRLTPRGHHDRRLLEHAPSPHWRRHDSGLQRCRPPH